MQPNASTGWPRGVLTGPGLTRVVRLKRPAPFAQRLGARRSGNCPSSAD